MKFPNQLSEFVYKRSYSRWIPEEGRREEWEETVSRVVNFLKENRPLDGVYDDIYKAILSMEVMPSMRLMAMAGPAAQRNNISLFNCCYVAVDDLVVFPEALYILMSGTGLGFSVERKYTEKLPVPKPVVGAFDYKIITVEDTTEGWADALKETIYLAYDGMPTKLDTRKIRPAGTRLKIKGGTSSGPAVLEELAFFVQHVIFHAAKQERKLKPIEVHDIMTKIGQIVVSGGVRRCLPKGTRVYTTRGAVPIEYVVPGDIVTTPKGNAKVSRVFEQGVQRTVKIVTSYGQVECTPNHRVAVFDSLDSWIYKEARNLSIGDRLVWDSYGVDGKETSLPEYKFSRLSHNTTGKELSIPVLDCDVAWLLGLFHGDGYVDCDTGVPRRANIAFNASEQSHAERAQRVISRFGVNSTIIPRKNENTVILKIHSTEFARYFYDNIKQAKTTLHIPDFIFYGTKDIRSAYIAGVIDSDGAVNNRPLVVVSTVYRDYAVQIQSLLATLGIGSKVSLNRPEKGTWLGIYHVTVKGIEDRKLLSELVGYHTSKTIPELSTNQRGYSFPTSFVDNKYGRSRLSSAKTQNTATITKNTRHAFRLLPVSVLEVIDSGRFAETYDIEVEDIHCFVADGFLVHNSALISLSDLDDKEMRGSKDAVACNYLNYDGTPDWGGFFTTYAHRAMANNSAVYESKPAYEEFLQEWNYLRNSGTGERGIFNRHAVNNTKPTRRLQRDDYSVNPCAEIVLRSSEFCNLSEIVARSDDTEETLLEKARVASIIGTIQSSFTDFPYIRSVYKQNCDEERLLGVSLTGWLDCPELMGNMPLMQKLRDKVIKTNRGIAQKLGINPSVATTCVKPSGSASQLTDTASGMHPRHSEYYIRRIRCNAYDPLSKLLMSANVPVFPENGQDWLTATTLVFEFPVKAPDGALTRHDFRASDQLDHWLQVKENYTEHNPSQTIYVGEDEWDYVGDWVYHHFNKIGGLSFLPRSEHVYQLAPYEDITKEEYEQRLADFPIIDYTKLSRFEKTDQTTSAQELSCVAGACEI